MRLKVYIDNVNNTISHFEIINYNNVIINYKIFNNLIHKEIYSTQYISNTDLKKVIHCMDLVELKEMLLVKDNKIEYIKISITKNKFILYKIEKELYLTQFSINTINTDGNVIQIVDFEKLLKTCKEYCYNDTFIKFEDNKISMCKNNTEYIYEQIDDNVFKINDNIYQTKEFKFKEMPMFQLTRIKNLILIESNNNIEKLLNIIKDHIII